MTEALTYLSSALRHLPGLFPPVLGGRLRVDGVPPPLRFMLVFVLLSCILSPNAETEPSAQLRMYTHSG
jgi:hypothetical protein